MSNMIERVARAIAEIGNGGVWTDEQWYKEYQRDFHRARAAAAVRAMREPTDEMLWEGGEKIPNVVTDARPIWEAMIDEALKASSPSTTSP